MCNYTYLSNQYIYTYLYIYMYIPFGFVSFDCGYVLVNCCQHVVFANLSWASKPDLCLLPNCWSISVWAAPHQFCNDLLANMN